MPRKVVEKPHNAGQWTRSRFHSFVAGALRQASNRWPPKFTVRKAAWIERGVYECAGYKRSPHPIPAKDVKVDHIDPVVDPAVGFVNWDQYIERLFVEIEKLQVLCETCHNHKSKDEKEIRKNGKTESN